MQKFTVSVLINRSQQDVFDFLSDPANLSKWDPHFESAEWTSSGAPGMGSIYRVSGRRLGPKKEGLFEIVQWDRPNRYSYKVKQRMFMVDRMETVFALKPKDNGTEVTFETQFELFGAWKLADGIFARGGKKQTGINLDNAKRLLEAG